MSEKKEKIAISGAGGILGGQILAMAADIGWDIIVLTSTPESLRKKYEGKNNIHFFERNCFDDVSWELVDVLVNCAFPINADGIELADGLGYVERLFLSASKGGVKAVINISSQSVYSQKRLEAAVEEDIPNLESCYAVGKYATELLTDAVFCGIPHTSLRLGNLVHENINYRILNRFIRQIVEGKDIHIWNNNQYFDCLDVCDAANAILKVATNDPYKWKSVYNLGTGKLYGILDFARIANEIAPTRGITPVKITCEQGAEEGNWRNTALDCQCICQQFDWKPEYSLEDTVMRIFDSMIAIASVCGGGNSL